MTDPQDTIPTNPLTGIISTPSRETEGAPAGHSGQVEAPKATDNAAQEPVAAPMDEYEANQQEEFAPAGHSGQVEAPKATDNAAQEPVAAPMDEYEANQQEEFARVNATRPDAANDA